MIGSCRLPMNSTCSGSTERQSGCLTILGDTIGVLPKLMIAEQKWWTGMAIYWTASRVILKRFGQCGLFKYFHVYIKIKQMLKTLKMLALLLSAVAVLSSCATVKTPLTGIWYTNVNAPVAVTGNSNSTKVGTSEATSILGLIATGDASIDAAAKSAGITKIHHVDEQGTSIFGLFAKYKVFVYGE